MGYESEPGAAGLGCGLGDSALLPSPPAPGLGPRDTPDTSAPKPDRPRAPAGDGRQEAGGRGQGQPWATIMANHQTSCCSRTVGHTLQQGPPRTLTASLGGGTVVNALLHTWKGRPGEALGTCLGPHRDKEFCQGRALHSLRNSHKRHASKGGGNSVGSQRGVSVP